MAKYLSTMNEQEQEYYYLGFNRGVSFASYITVVGENEDGDKLYCGEGEPVDWETIISQCYDAEISDRDFSPFEFTAHAINEQEDADELWSAFDDGISEGILYTMEHIEE